MCRKKVFLENGEYLSLRELEVLQVVSDGYTTKEIANKLFISVKTVETHRSNLLLKMGVSNVAKLIKVATKLNLVVWIKNLLRQIFYL